MTLVELLNLANSGYPDGDLASYFDPETGEDREGSGDTLAQFVVGELGSTFDPELPREDQIAEAERVIERAIQDLRDVLRAIR